MASKVTRIRDWRTSLKITAKGLIAPEAGNAFLLLTNGEWEGTLSYDEFEDRTFWSREPPELDGFTAPRLDADLHDCDEIYVQHYLSRVGCGGDPGALFKTESIRMAMQAAAKKNSTHPLRKYLRGLTWDRESRLKTWIHECLGAELSDYTSAVGTWWLISAVARALEPGCQADHMLLLQGHQGARKSTALRILAGKWYLPELPDVRSKDAAHILNGRWIVECGELSSLRRHGVTDEAIKDFLSREIDVYRKPYGKNMVRRPRSVVFAGTTNDKTPLNDPTGARRYWPITCGLIDVKKLKACRDQLWAEAVVRFELGEQWHPTNELEDAVKNEQDQRYQEDSWEGLVLPWAAKRQDGFTLRDAMTCIGLEPEKWSRANETRVGAILTRAGYTSERVRLGDERVRQYSRVAKVAE